MNRRCILTGSIIALVYLGLGVAAASAFAQQADTDEVKAASKAFYTALAVIDDGTAMAKVWAQSPYVTMVGPRSRSILVGWDAHKKYWADANKRFSQRNVSLSDQHIHVNGNLAWEMGQENGDLQMTDGTAGKADFIVTNVYEKVDGRWLMVSHHVQPKPR